MFLSSSKDNEKVEEEFEEVIQLLKVLDNNIIGKILMNLLRSMKDIFVKDNLSKITLNLDDKWRTCLIKDIRDVLNLNDHNRIIAYLGKDFLLIPRQSNSERD